MTVRTLGRGRQPVGRPVMPAIMPQPIDPRQLHHGPYNPPPLRRGDKATCLYRDSDVVITSWSNGRIPWPRCRRPETCGGTGLLVDEELARAIRLESSIALQYWFGVSEATVWYWRQALGVERSNEGTARLHMALVNRPEERERRRRTARELGLRPPPHPGGRPWTAQELRLLGTMPDDELAERIGRTATAVRCMRTRRGIATAKDRQREHRGRG